MFRKFFSGKASYAGGLLFFIAILCIPDIYKRNVHPFRLSRLKMDLPKMTSWETSAPNLEIRSLLEKPFIFLAKGKQSDVFLSADGQYVLKFFHFDRSRLQEGKKIRSLLKTFLGLHKNDVGLHRMDRVYQTFESCKIAYEFIPDLTGIVYAHLNLKSHFLPKIKIKGRFGFFYDVDPAKYRFVIQKRGTPLMRAMQTSSIEELNDLKTSLFSLLDQMCAASVINADLAPYKNFNICNGKIIISDVGNFIYDPLRAQENSMYFKSKFESFIQKKIENQLKRT